ncbi:MAG: class I SAM-dependent methyltransferase [Candidatus Thorarchaeota archaeon]
MPDWDNIFTEQGRVFNEPHQDMTRLVELFQDRDVTRILDLGCGTGRHLIFLSRMGFEVYGFDASPKALSLAQQWLDEEGLTADIQKHRMEEPFPYGSGFFDAVISIQVIHHNLMADILTTVGEVERVMKPGGVLFVSVPVMHMGPVEKEHDWDCREVGTGTYIPHKGPESGIPHHYFTPAELTRVLSAFNPLELYIDDTDHRCFLGVKR